LFYVIPVKKYQTVVTPGMFYEIGYWAVKKQHENKASVWRWGCCVVCVVRLDEIRLEMTTL
jgi:hypothetical protein